MANSSKSGGPVGTGDYVVRQGDCISSIADEAGLTWEKLWNLPENAELKSRRKNPNALLPGDRLVVPQKELREVSAPTDKNHTFVRKSAPAKFRIVLERYQQPLAGKHYIATIDGTIYEGTTSETGLLELVLPPNASSGVLRIPSENLECNLQLGYLDPWDEVSGAQARLQNLGYYHGTLDGQLNDETQEALEWFQSDFGVEVTGQLDDATKQKLLDRHDQEHDAPPLQTAPPASQPVSNEIPADESDMPTEDEDALEFQRLDAEDEE
jgi:putative peptidoglycan binding protein/LysM domain-containing protein